VHKKVVRIRLGPNAKRRRAQAAEAEAAAAAAAAEAQGARAEAATIRAEAEAAAAAHAAAQAAAAERAARLARIEGAATPPCVSGPQPDERPQRARRPPAHSACDAFWSSLSVAQARLRRYRRRAPGPRARSA